MSMKLRSLWLSATPRRAMLEALPVAALTALAALPFIGQQPLRLGIQDTVVVLLVTGPCCALWCALRLRLDNGEWWQRAVLYAATGCVLSIIPTTTATLWLLRRFADPTTSYASDWVLRWLPALWLWHTSSLRERLSRFARPSMSGCTGMACGAGIYAGR